MSTNRRDNHRFDLPRANYLDVPASASRFSVIKQIPGYAAVLKPNTILKRLVYAGAATVVVLSIAIPLIVVKPKLHAQTSTQGPNSPTTCAQDTAVGTTAWSGNNYGNATASDNTRVTHTTAVSGQNTYLIKCTQYGFSIPANATIAGIVVSNERHAATDGGLLGNAFRDNAIRVVKAGTVGSTDKSITLSTWETTDTVVDYGSATDLWGDSWTASDINNSGFGAAVGARHLSSTSNTARVDYISITVYYYGFPEIIQKGYIWENDDEDQAGGDVYDENSQQVAGNTAITSVRKGERLTLRMQLQNSGAATLNSGMGLFYDKNDGNFRQVTFPRTIPSAGSGCASGATSWDCSLIHSSGIVGTDAQVGTTADGRPAAVYTNSTNDIISAEYVGSGGSGCDASATDWSCETVVTSDVGFSDVATGPNGKRYGLYYTSFGSANTPQLAEYVGTGGSGCTSSAWTCTTISVNTNNDAANSVTELGVAGDGTVYAVVRLGQGAGGNQNLCIRSAGTWSCSVFTDIVAPSFASTEDVKGMSFFGGTSDLIYAEYVGSGGDCSNTAWECTSVETTGTIGNYSSLTYSPDGTPYISYYDTTNGDLTVAHYVGASGSGCTGATTTWTCDDVDNSNEGQFTSIAFSPSGVPYVSYYDNGAADLKLAQYVGSGGSCSNTAWKCTTIDDTIADVGKHTSISFGINGQPYVGYYDETSDNFRVATLPVGDGEISLALPSGGRDGDSINESHVDMGTPPDNTDRDDADCISGTWNNGKLFGVQEPSNLGLPGDGCTEIAFIIDISQAVAGTTYRFVIATSDSFQDEKGKWRGPTAIDQYPTLTIATDTDFKSSKSTEPQGTAACNGSVWTCTLVEGTNAVGEYSSMAMSPSGVPYISFYDTTGDDLRIAQYVGSGGAGCTGGSSAWTCTTIDDTITNVGQYTSIAFSSTGVPYISYYDVTNANLRVAQYVGTGGTGCKSGLTTWTCTIIESTDAAGEYSSIAISPSGVPYISYYNNTDDDLRVAYYDGDGTASNCAGGSNAWTCLAVDSSVTLVGLHTAIAFSPSGTPYISYYDDTNDNLRVAQYVGSGGAGCTATTAYTCTLIEATNAVGEYTSIAFNASGVPYISYYDNTNDDLRYAFYDGDGTASGCTGGSNAWTCTTIDDTTALIGLYTSIAFSPDNVPYISYYDSTNGNLRLAEYVTSGGSGCKSGVTDWTCITVEATNDVGQYSSIAFSSSGVPYISNYDLTNGNIRLTKLELFDTKPEFSSNFTNPGRSARWGNGLFSLSDGRSPRTNGTGVCSNGIANYLGICGLYDDGGHAESVTGTAYQRPQFNFSQRFDANTILPTAAWRGRSDVAPSTASTAGDIKLQVYRFGSTNAWTDVATDSSSTNCNTDNCNLLGIPGGTISDYFESDGAGKYWMYWRVWQYENASGSETLKTDLFQLQFINKQLRHGKLFENNTKRVFTF